MAKSQLPLKPVLCEISSVRMPVAGVLTITAVGGGGNAVHSQRFFLKLPTYYEHERVEGQNDTVRPNRVG
jgi:hypothetical protein